MKGLDSASAANWSTLIGTTISNGMAAVLVFFIIFLMLRELLKSGKLDAVLDFLKTPITLIMSLRKNSAETSEILATLKQVRADQVVSNQVRLSHAARLDALEELVRVKVCGMAPTCPNRQDVPMGPSDPE